MSLEPSAPLEQNVAAVPCAPAEESMQSIPASAQQSSIPQAQQPATVYSRPETVKSGNLLVNDSLELMTKVVTVLTQ